MPVAAQLTAFVRHILLAVLLIVLAAATPAVAQQETQPPQPSQDAPAVQPATPPAAPPPAEIPAPAAPAPTAIVAEQQAVLAGLTIQVNQLEKDVAANSSDDAKLVEARLALEGVLGELLASGQAFRPRLTEINSRLDQLGPAPSSDQPSESETVAGERQALTTEKAEINVLLGKAEDLSVRVKALDNKIANLRRDLFTNLLTKRYELGDAISDQVVSDLRSELRTFNSRAAASLRFAFRFKMQSVLTAALLSLLVAIVVQFGGKRLFGRLLYRDPALAEPGYIRRLAVAFWSSLLPAMALGLCFAVAMGLFAYFGIFTGDMRVFMWGILSAILAGFIVNRVARAVLSPDLPHWRLIPVEPRPARALVWLMTALGLVVGLDSAAGQFSEILGSPLSVTIVKSLVASILSGALIIAMARVRPFLDKDGSPRAWPGWFRFVLYVIGVGSILAAIAGYISLAQFVSAQIVITGAVLTTAYIGLLASSAISAEGGFAKTTPGRWLKANKDIEDNRLDQLGVLASVLINIVIVLLFLPLILFMFRFQPGDIAAWIRRLANGFSIGAFSFSPLAIVTGVFVFAIGSLLTRWFQRWLDGTVMARGRVEPGVRNSIRTVVGYACHAIALLVAISAAGFDLSNIALVAGGLSLGIGFGLQNIVSNFVSGLILLVERPLKAGDWVEAGGFSGTVKKISVRATEIETFQRQTVVLPNSTLINGAVGNWTLRNKLGRVEIAVGVVYGSDARQVAALLLEIGRSHPMVLRNPEPAVLFTDFTDTAMTFELRVFLADINSGGRVRSDIRFAILEAFERENIELAHTLKAETPISTDLETLVDADARDAAEPAAASEAPEKGTPSRGPATKA